MKCIFLQWTLMNRLVGLYEKKYRYTYPGYCVNLHRRLFLQTVNTIIFRLVTEGVMARSTHSDSYILTNCLGSWPNSVWSISSNSECCCNARFNSVAKFSPTKLNQTEFLTKGINSYLFTEGALDFSPTKRNLLLILEISHQPVGEKCHTI